MTEDQALAALVGISLIELWEFWLIYNLRFRRVSSRRQLETRKARRTYAGPRSLSSWSVTRLKQ